MLMSSASLYNRGRGIHLASFANDSFVLTLRNLIFTKPCLILTYYLQLQVSVSFVDYYFRSLVWSWLLLSRPYWRFESVSEHRRFGNRIMSTSTIANIPEVERSTSCWRMQYSCQYSPGDDDVPGSKLVLDFMQTWLMIEQCFGTFSHTSLELLKLSPLRAIVNCSFAFVHRSSAPAQR